MTRVHKLCVSGMPEKISNILSLIEDEENLEGIKAPPSCTACLLEMSEDLHVVRVSDIDDLPVDPFYS